MLSIVILTLNEERNLPSCLASVAQCDDVVVLDSGSTDRTLEIARGAGAAVFTNPFENFGQQRNYAQDNIPFKHPWVLHLDADEQMTPELWEECVAAVASSSATQLDGYWIAPKMMFRGRWIPRCTDYPAYQARLVKAPEFRFIQVGHGQREAPDMRMSHLKESYLHNLSAESEDSWLSKHRRYAQEEAAQHEEKFRGSVRWRNLCSSDALVRRRTLKQLSYAFPFRPELRFIYQYILKRGFLHGMPGLKYCLLLRRYEQFVNQARQQQLTRH